MALDLPQAVEKAHMGHPDFRTKDKIFATLGPGEEWGMVKLTPEQQRDFVREQPKVFQSIKGAWGARGCTKVILEAATAEPLRRALVAAWRNTAPKRVVEQFEDDL